MNNTVVLYKSKYGAAKKYAEWLSQDLCCDLLLLDKVKIEQLQKYKTVILGGGIYASGISGISFLKKHYDKLSGKNLVVFAVGASPYDEKTMTALRERNFKDRLANIPCYYCRGAWNENIMSWRDKTLCKMLKKAVSKKDPKTYEPWESALMEAIGSNCDWTDKENLKDIIDYVRTK
ncbi:MAG: flavodoxin domain-containing protein [Clostridiaceae bacterium]